MKRLLYSFLLFSFLTLWVSPAKAQAVVHSTTINWILSTSTGATYNAYKQAGCAGAFVKQNTVPIIAASFTDTGMADNELNCYLFTASIIVSGTSFESSQIQSEVIRVLTPTFPTVTLGQTAVAPPTKPVVKAIS